MNHVAFTNEPFCSRKKKKTNACNLKIFSQGKKKHFNPQGPPKPKRMAAFDIFSPNILEWQFLWPKFQFVILKKKVASTVQAKQMLCKKWFFSPQPFEVPRFPKLGPPAPTEKLPFGASLEKEKNRRGAPTSGEEKRSQRWRNPWNPWTLSLL